MSEFFTRLIANNSIGPNLQQSDDGDVEMVYICGTCDEAHSQRYSAESCCPVEVYEEWRCGTCMELHGEKEDAIACCIPGSMPMRCPVCMKLAESYQDAADCCLFLHPSIAPDARERIADAVKSGVSWADAIKANEKK